MTSSHFFVKNENIRYPVAILEGKEHLHLQRVLRAKPGKRIWIVDERGSSYRAEIEELGQDRTRLRLLEKEEKEEPKVRIGLAQAVLKGKKMEFLIQKGTELGMHFFIPVITERSIVRLAGKETLKVERWRRVAREAVKQSRSRLIPEILPLISWTEFLKDRREEKKYILCENQGKFLRDIVSSPPVDLSTGSGMTVLLLIGPEGGWTSKEEESALSHGFEAVSLGRRILRSETASLASLALISHFWGQ